MPSLSDTNLPQPNEGIELLVNLARQGQIDPWNVDITEVAERYLATVKDEVEQVIAEKKAAIEENPAVKQLSLLDNKDSLQLRRSGKTLLYLAILLRMKSDLLAGLDPFALLEEEELIEDADWDDLITYDEDGNPIQREQLALQQQEAVSRLTQHLRRRIGSLDEVLSRRRSSKQQRIRAVTLDDLIRELKRAEAHQQEREAHLKLKRAETRRRAKDFSRLTTEDITEGLAHDEFQESYVLHVQTILEEHLPHRPIDGTATPPRLSLASLVELTGLSQVVVFLSLLFLEARFAIETVQPEFYSEELWVQWPAPLAANSPPVDRID